MSPRGPHIKARISKGQAIASVYKSVNAKVVAKIEPDAQIVEAKARTKRRASRAQWFKDRRVEKAFALNARVSAAIRKSLAGSKAGRAWESLVGYDLPALKLHLEQQFSDGMTWATMGQWHIDHIVPLSAFKITGPDCPEFKAAWALSNLRPLWAADNLKKRARRTHLL